MTFDTSWVCSICGRKRPSDKIDVRIVDVSEKNGFPPKTLHKHIRFCKDNAACAGKMQEAV